MVLRGRGTKEAIKGETVVTNKMNGGLYKID